MDFVAGHREQINAEFANVYGNFPDGLNRIGMQQNAAAPGYFADLLDGLNHSGFVVRMHHGNQQSGFAHGRFNRLGIHAPGSIDGNIGNFSAGTFQRLAGGQNRRVLDLCRDDMVARAIAASEDTPEGGIIGFSPSGSEDNFARVGAQQFGDGAAGALPRLPALPGQRYERSWHFRNSRGNRAAWLPARDHPREWSRYYPDRFFPSSCPRIAYSVVLQRSPNRDRSESVAVSRIGDGLF